MVLFCVMAGAQFSSGVVEFRQAEPSTWLERRGLAPVAGWLTACLVLAGLGWLRMVKAGKFCHARRVWFAGQELMYGARSVQAHDCGTPVSNQTGMGKRPSNWRKIICCLASVEMDCKRS